MTNIAEMMNNPLMQRAQSTTSLQGSFLRLVLAEAINYGMPPQVIATLDDVAAMLGCYEPLPEGQAAHLAAPLVTWRTHKFQPDYQDIVDIQMLAYKQRCLIAFGAAPPGHMVGTAEIVHAMTNVHQNLLEKDGASTDYREVFYWAAVDVLALVEGRSRDAIWKDRGWKVVHDDEVLKPTGRLHGPYTLIATSIRRTAISALQSDPDNPRKMLLPVARVLLNAHASALDECRERDLPEAVQQITDAIRTIREMFPELVEDRVAAAAQ